jgi:hypothetical protein
MIHDHNLDRENLTTLILSCLLFIAFKVGACEYKIMSTPHVFSSSLLTLRYWVLDSAWAFPFTFSPSTTTFSIFLSSLSSVLDFLFSLLKISSAHIDYSASNAINTPNKMRRYYIFSGILLVLPIINFAVAAPALVQDKRQPGVDVVHIPEDAITMLGKRGDGLNELWLKLFGPFKDHFAKPESSAARPSAPADGWTDLEQPLPSIPEEPEPVSSPDHAPQNPGSLTQSGYELMNWDAPPGPSGPASSTMSSTDHEMMEAHALPNPGTSTGSGHKMVDVPPPPGSASPTETDYDMMDVPPWPGSASPMEFDHEMVDFPPSS